MICSAAETCERTVVYGSKQLCRTHYEKLRTTGTLLPLRRGALRKPSLDRLFDPRPIQKTCTECDRPVIARGLCRNHYVKLRRTGTLERTRRTVLSEDDRSAAHLWSRYRITKAEYNRILARQGGGCGICGTISCRSGKRLAVDHEHETGRIRGLLCQRCNTSLERFETVERFAERVLAYKALEAVLHTGADVEVP